MTPADISVVIPTLNEAHSVRSCVESVVAAGAGQIIVSDGGSDDATLEMASQAGATQTVRSIPGRGIQLNAGAFFARGEFVLFLHADNRLAKESLSQVVDAAERSPKLVWGAMRQRIESDRYAYRFLERGNAMRVRIRGIAMGDQSLWVRRSEFKRVGGFPEVRLMEDVELSQKLRRLSWPVLLQGPTVVSARRWEARGVIQQTLRNQVIQVAHACGVAHDRLANFYR